MILAERRRRIHFFEAGIFGEPAWDILLTLYGAEQVSGRQTIEQLVRWIQFPATTALRWIAYLERSGLVVRTAHPIDQRTMFIELSEEARARLTDYLADVSVIP
jgi:DNA-binding MarR family transcriptional regulator